MTLSTKQQQKQADLMTSQFIEKASKSNSDVEALKVLKSRTYRIGDSNVLVRYASPGKRGYFYGLNYLTAEEIANLDNPFIAFICGSLDTVVIIPARFLFKYLPQISSDRNGEYKITIRFDMKLALKGRNNRLDCSPFVNNWDSILFPPDINHEQIRNTAEESLHSVIQGRLIEIGNIRGYQTYCPDKSRQFNEQKLDDITTLKTCPKLQFSDYSLLRLIDVLWFRPKGGNLIPEYAFEVELSTGVWSGVGRMATLADYANVGLYVIANDGKKFNQVSRSLDLPERYKFIESEKIGDLYAAELKLKHLRIDIGL